MTAVGGDCSELVVYQHALSREGLCRQVLNMRTRCRVEVSQLCANNGQQLSNTVGLTMSPSIESVASRGSLCYIIEEEPCYDLEGDNNSGRDLQVHNSGARQQNEAENNNNNNVLSAVRQNIKMCESELDNFVHYTNGGGHVDVFSRLLNLTDADGGSAGTAVGPVSTRKLPTGRRRTASQSSTNTQSSTSHGSLRDTRQNVEFSSNYEVKSGNLVMIIPEQRQASSSFASTGASPRTANLSRYPVIVKIHQRSYDKFAIVSRTRRHSNTPTFFLKLKHSHVTPSLSNPSHFVVTDSGPAAKSVTFEASSPETAIQWIKAFSSDFSYSSISSMNSPHFRGRRDLYSRVGLQSTPSSTHLVSNRIAPPLMVSHSNALPVLSESATEDDDEQSD